MRLGVNIDHVATLRQTRRTVYPDPLDAAILCARAGAHGITVHLREDRRHIQEDDVFRLRELQPLPLNLEMANAEPIIKTALNLRPAEVCLVPEKRQELTTEGGLDAVGQFNSLKETVQCLSEAGIEVSLFVDANEETLAACKELGASAVELHTGAYCTATSKRCAALMDKLICGAEYAHALGIKVNAGHGIHIENLEGILRIPHLNTLNIGHSIICRAVFYGLEHVVKEILNGIKKYNR